ncbi:hypothetical protein HDV00_001026 [Rhizophlyctis rosea]|nr:hypothetical protein HDV00_001026 [Rhizophlyctis rosea]
MQNLHPVSDTSRDISSECAAYSEHLQNLLSEDKELWPKYLPITNTNELFAALQDGILLAHLINAIRPNTINVSKLNRSINPAALAPTTPASATSPTSSKDYFEATHNLNAVLESLKQVPNIVVVNVGAEDFLNRKTDLVLGVLWQIVRAHLLSSVNLPSHMELVRLLDARNGETLQGLLGLSSEAILVRWFNYHLERSGKSRKITSLNKDVTDGECYLLLLKQVAPGDKKAEVDQKVEQGLRIDASDKQGSAKVVLEVAEILGVRKFVTAKDIVEGHARLNFAFVATVFSKHIGIHLPTEDESRAIAHRLSILESANTQMTAKIAELESKLADAIQAKAEMQSAKDAEKTMLESAAESANVVHQAAMDGAKAQIASLNSEVDEVKGAYELLKAEQTAFRKQVGSKLGQVRAILQDHVDSVRTDTQNAARLRKLLGQTREPITALLPTPSTETAPPPLPRPTPSTPEEELDSLSSELRSLMKEILDENHEQANLINLLANRAEKEEKINSVMAEKIREYSEALIRDRKVKVKGGSVEKLTGGLGGGKSKSGSVGNLAG